MSFISRKISLKLKWLIIIVITTALSGCISLASKPEYIYVQPECSAAMRPTLPTIDAGKLYSALVLPHTLYDKDLSELAPELLNGYDGDKTYHDLVEREKLIVDTLIENEAILKKVCSPSGG